MPISQYVYFALSSRDTSAAEMTAILGIEPDEISVSGSRIANPRSIPVLHRWKVVCREPGLCIDEQVARVLARLAPHMDDIAALARRLDAEVPRSPSAVLEVVRYFKAETDDQPDRLADEDAPAAASDLFGWHLGRDVLDFLQVTGAVLDVDEYDMTPNLAERPGLS